MSCTRSKVQTRSQSKPLDSKSESNEPSTKPKFENEDPLAKSGKILLEKRSTEPKFESSEPSAKATKKSDDDDPSTSGLRKSSPEKSGSPPPQKNFDDRPPIIPGKYENINLLKMISGPVMVNGELCQFESVKDIVNVENFKKLSKEAQQYLLRLYSPKGDLIEKEDGTLEPKFGAFKNEYFTADLLDYTERLLTGEIPPHGEIAPAPEPPKVKTSIGRKRVDLIPKKRQESGNGKKASGIDLKGDGDLMKDCWVVLERMTDLGAQHQQITKVIDFTPMHTIEDVPIKEALPATCSIDDVDDDGRSFEIP